MILSMTGFGDAYAERDGTHYAVEIRALNNRFFKSAIKLPEPVAGLEPELESVLRERLGRILTLMLDQAWRNRIDSYFRSKHPRESRCHLHHARFADRMRNVAGPALECGEIGNIDYRSTLCPHERSGSL